MRKHISALALSAVLALSLAGAAFANGNGSGTDMQVYYDCEVHTVNFTQVSLNSSHSQINFIYEFPDCPGFLPVIDQITGGENTNPPPKNGFNPLWQLVEVHFNGGCPTSQVSSGFCSDNCIVPTSCLPITLEYTGKVFRCSVVGQKSPKGP